MKFSKVQQYMCQMKLNKTPISTDSAFVITYSV